MPGAADTNKQPATITSIASIETFESNLIVMKTSFRSEVRCIVYPADCFQQSWGVKLRSPRVESQERAIRDRAGPEVRRLAILTPCGSTIAPSASAINAPRVNWW